MDNINIKVKSVIDDLEIIQFFHNLRLENSEKEGDENYEMYNYLKANVFKIPSEVVVEVVEVVQDGTAGKNENQPDAPKN
jgi:hypothetical protein